ncbi:family 1 glycosylhydrolase [Amycolatopsis tolypomycina]|uniref:family 1 glycosylhydrolase n=1 Tax=Amycolatopsis tolypomycina TaxID=208445 RepID=UPI001FC9F459|nr:family 1 glycosylhydrolase [Amycolatopsis tolypomycina]
MRKPTTRRKSAGSSTPKLSTGTIRRVHRVSGGKPILLTENGIATTHDPKRVAFMDRALRAVHTCLADGIDVRGYLHWSLLDNYEWSGGFEPTFGLVAVDRQTFARRPKESAYWLGDVARSRCLPAEPVTWPPRRRRSDRSSARRPRLVLSARSGAAFLRRRRPRVQCGPLLAKSTQCIDGVGDVCGRPRERILVAPPPHRHAAGLRRPALRRPAQLPAAFLKGLPMTEQSRGPRNEPGVSCFPVTWLESRSHQADADLA